MDGAAVARMLLTFPASALAMFSAFAFLGWSSFALSGVLGDRLPGLRAATGWRMFWRRWLRAQAATRARSRMMARRRAARHAVAVSGVLVGAAMTGLVAGTVAALPSTIAASAARNTGVLAWLVPWLLMLLGPVAGVGAVLWFVRFAMRPDAATDLGWPRPIAVPSGGVAVRNRFDVSREVFRYEVLRMATVAAAWGGLAGVLIGVGPPPDTEPSGSVPEPADAWQLLWPAGIILAFLMMRLLRRLVDLLAPHCAAVTAVSACLVAPPASNRSRRVAGVRVPFVLSRARLFAAAGKLTTLAARMDTAAPMHPVGTMLWAAATRLRGHLHGVASLASPVPGEVRQTLEHAMVLIIGPRTRADYAAISGRLAGFDGGGEPRPEIRTVASGRWSTLVGRTVTFLETYSRLTTAAWAILTALAVGYLIATGRLNLSDIQIQK